MKPSRTARKQSELARLVYASQLRNEELTRRYESERLIYSVRDQQIRGLLALLAAADVDVEHGLIIDRQALEVTLTAAGLGVRLRDRVDGIRRARGAARSGSVVRSLYGPVV